MTEQLYDGEGVTLESNKPFEFVCCDCGLKHHMVIVSEDGLPVGFAVKRIARSAKPRVDGIQPPPLPQPYPLALQARCRYTANQMRDYALAAIAATTEPKP